METPELKDIVEIVTYAVENLSSNQISEFIENVNNKLTVDKKVPENELRKIIVEAVKAADEKTDSIERYTKLLHEQVHTTSTQKITDTKNFIKQYMLNEEEDFVEAFILENIKEYLQLTVVEIRNVCKGFRAAKKELKKKSAESGSQDAETSGDKEKLDFFEDIDFDEKTFDEETIKKADVEAERIMREGDPIAYIKNSIATVHVGDENTIEGLCVSVAGQSVLNTAGIQIAVNGESGSGKSHGAKAFLHRMPKRFKRATSLSSKALYYMNLREGMIIYSDDTDMDEDLATLFKQSTTNYQEKTFRTTVKDGETNVLSIPARTNLLLTCVESHVSDQVLNRQLVFETDASIEQKLRIYNKQKELEKNKMTDLTVTFEVLVCRRIFTKIKSKTFNVGIPFAERINLQDYSNSRIQPLLFDMIRGFAVMNFMQREVDSDGWIMATQDDFNAAKKLFKTREQNTITKMTGRETDIIKYIKNHQGPQGCSINEIATGTKMSVITVRRLLNGRTDRPDEDGGLLSKVKGLTKEQLNDTNTVKSADGSSKSRGRRTEYYKLHDSFDPWQLFESNRDFVTIAGEVGV